MALKRIAEIKLWRRQPFSVSREVHDSPAAVDDEEIKDCNSCDIFPGLDPAQHAIEIPDEFLCPVSLELMVRPMTLLQSGQTYEFTSIDKWLCQATLESGFKDPMTGCTMKEGVTLRPNMQLQAQIAEWCEQNNITYNPPAWPNTCGQQSRQKVQEEQSGLVKCAQSFLRLLLSRRQYALDPYAYAGGTVR